MKGLPKEIAALDEEILAFIHQGVEHRDEDTFNRLALKAFALQFRLLSPYREYCARRGVTPERISSWEEIPPLPTEAFKVAEISLFPQLAARTFMTSGTTRGEERGRVTYDQGGLALMDATIDVAAASYLFPEGGRYLIFIIAPPPALAPHMVMAYGMERLRSRFGLPESRFLVSENGFQIDLLVDALHRAEAEEIPTAIFGGSFGFVNFFDYCRQVGIRFSLPPGSRCLDAGGFKGRSREVTREEFLVLCEEFLGVPNPFCVNLLGMTELASQFYDNTIYNRYKGLDLPRRKTNPPWTRTLVVDPETLEPLPPGEEGFLRHFDLANRGHCCAIQTDDLGFLWEGGFEVLGRATGGEGRGCSLTIDEMTRIAK